MSHLYWFVKVHVSANVITWCTHRLPQSIFEMTFICSSCVWSCVSVAPSSSRRLSSRDSITLRRYAYLYVSRSCGENHIGSRILECVPCVSNFHSPQTVSSTFRTTRAAPACTRWRWDRRAPCPWRECTCAEIGRRSAASADRCRAAKGRTPREFPPSRRRPGRDRAARCRASCGWLCVRFGGQTGGLSEWECWYL